MVQKTQIDHAAEWVMALKFEDIPDSVISFARAQILSCLGAISAGARSSTGMKLSKALLMDEETGKCTMLPWGEKCTLFNAIYYHSAMINALELDDFVFMGHISQSAVSVPITLGEMLDSNGREVLRALVAAEEVAGRLSAYMVSGPLQGHMRSFIHRTAGAVAASCLLSLDRDQTANAISIALSSPEHPLLRASFSPETKVNITSAATIEGVRSAMLAKEGMEGARDIIEHPNGFFRQFSFIKRQPDIWLRLGKTWTLDTISFKEFATCAYAQGPVTAALNLYRNEHIVTGEIEHVVIHVPIVTIVMEKFSIPHNNTITPVNCNFSTIRSVSAALQFGDLNGDFFMTGEFENRIEAIAWLTDKISLRHDWKMTIDLVRGMDQGIKNAGHPGFLGQGSANKAFNRFKRESGSRKLIGLRDIPELISLPRKDLSYFISRYYKAFTAIFVPYKTTRNKDKYFSREFDLRKMDFPLAGRVDVHLTNGKVLSASCRRPNGFAGSPDRIRIAEKKFERETRSYLDKDEQLYIKQLIDNLEDRRVGEIAEPFLRVKVKN